VSDFDDLRRGERQRLALMSQLLDPMHRRLLKQLGAGPGMRTLEVGCGNASVSGWLAAQVAPGGRAVAVDLDLSLADAAVPGLQLRQADIMSGPVEPADFDLVTCRALLQRQSDPVRALANLVTSARPGGTILVIEPDFLPIAAAEPTEVREFWAGWLAWARGQGIDCFIGRRLPRLAVGQELQEIGASAETALYNGGSQWAEYWRLTIAGARGQLEASGCLDRRRIDSFLARCEDPAWWTQTIAFTTVHGRVPG
jgi:SAM-dependent methyltransferase